MKPDTSAEMLGALRALLDAYAAEIDSPSDDEIMAMTIAVEKAEALVADAKAKLEAKDPGWDVDARWGWSCYFLGWSRCIWFSAGVNVRVPVVHVVVFGCAVSCGRLVRIGNCTATTGRLIN